jgi:hypothetical protein
MSDYELTRLYGIYDGSNGDATRALYQYLEGRYGAAGALAVNLFRACKTSSRAKKYRGRYVGAAYDTKDWSLQNLCRVLGDSDRWDARDGAGLGIVWDAKTINFEHVLYVTLPTGQVSFHARRRGDGPDFPDKWDGVIEAAATRILLWIAQLCATDPSAPPPAPQKGSPHHDA